MATKTNEERQGDDSEEHLLRVRNSTTGVSENRVSNPTQTQDLSCNSSQHGSVESNVAEMGTQPEHSTSRIKRVCHKLCRPNVLTFTLASALILLTQINLAVFMVTQLTSLEREFGFTSKQMGRLLSANEIGFLCFVLPGGYLASKVHVPRAMAVTALSAGLAGILTGLPHFIFQASSESHEKNGSSVVSAASIPPAFCLAEDDPARASRCAAVHSHRHNSSVPGADHDLTNTDAVYSHRAFPVFVFLMLCQVVRGAMGASRFPMFSEYIETNAKKTDTGFYMGIVAAIAMLGPVIAFIGGGAISKLHVSLQPTDLTPTHPQWVGAWWLGFLLFGSLAAMAPLFLWRFPGSLTSPASIEHTPTARGTRRSCKKLIFDVLGEMKGFVMAVVRMLMNPVLLCLVIASCLFSFSMNGTYIFLPKYLQNQFGLPAWKANYIMGGAELVCGTSGFFLGGWLTRRLKLTVPALYKLTITSTTILSLFVVVLMYIGCPQPLLSGSPSGTSHGNASSNCTLSCACPEEVFPVCDRSAEVNYFSPCHAGCQGLENGVYTNCSCTASGQANPGLCTSDCVSVYYFSAIFYVMIFMMSVPAPMNYLLLVRCVPSSQTGLAVGINSFCAGLVGYLIGPMVFGGVIDNVCEHWKTACGVKGQCAVYNNRRFRVDMHLYTVTALALTTVAYIVSFAIFKCKKVLVERMFCMKPGGGGVQTIDEIEVSEENGTGLELTEGLILKDNTVIHETKEELESEDKSLLDSMSDNHTDSSTTSEKTLPLVDQVATEARINGGGKDLLQPTESATERGDVDEATEEFVLDSSSQPTESATERGEIDGATEGVVLDSSSQPTESATERGEIDEATEEFVLDRSSQPTESATERGEIDEATEEFVLDSSSQPTESATERGEIDEVTEECVLASSTIHEQSGMSNRAKSDPA